MALLSFGLVTVLLFDLIETLLKPPIFCLVLFCFTESFTVMMSGLVIIKAKNQRVQVAPNEMTT